MADPDLNLTPEQRLLKLIEEQDSKDASTAKETAPVPTPVQAPPSVNIAELLSPQALAEQFLYLKEKWAHLFKEQKGQFRLRTVNVLIRTLVILFGVIVMFSVMADMQTLNKNYLTDFDTSPKKMAELGTPAGAELSPSFFENLSKRNVFVPYAKRAEAEAQSSALSLKLLEITKNYKLTGISINPVDPARTFCMIEDIGKNMTTFLRKGDAISGMRVSEIKSDSVILKYNDEVIEIR